MPFVVLILRCITMDDAYHAIHWSSLVLLAGMLSLADALEKTGGTAIIVQANYLVRIDPNIDEPEHQKAQVFAYNGEGSGYKKIHSYSILGATFPRSIYITNHGELVTIDSWYEAEGEYAIAIYDISGSKSKAYSLLDLYSQKNVDEFPKTTSSRHWHCSNVGIIPVGNHSLKIVDKYERVLEIDAQEMTVTFLDGHSLDCPYFLGTRQ